MSNAPHFDIDVPSFWADPYPALARMRKEAPIAFVPQLGSTVFTRRDDIFTQEKRIDVFSSHQPAGLMNVLMGHNMMRKDGDAHMAERAGDVSRGVAAHRARHLGPAVPGPCRPHPRRAGAARRADLCKALALPLSAECLKDVTGLTNMRYQDMDAWSQAMIDGIANYTGNKEVEARCHAATAGIDAAIDDMIPVVKKHPEHLDPQRAAGLGPEHGKHPRQHQAGDLGRPERAARRHRRHDLGAADASRAARAGARRQGKMDRRVRGICALDRADRHVAATRREAVVAMAASISSRKTACSSCSARPIATRPASRDPDSFDVTRDTQKSIAFGAGPHYCAGAFASRAMVADVALPSVFARLKGLRLDDSEPVRIGGWAFRGLLNLPVRWDAG